MKEAWPKILFSGIVCVVMTLNIIFSLFSGLLLLNADRIVYAKMEGVYQVCEVDFANDEVRVCNYNIYGYPEPWKEAELSAWNAVRIKACAALAQLPLWLENYNTDETEQSAVFWTVELHRNNIVHRSTGSSEPPVGWNLLIPKLEKLIDNIIDDAGTGIQLPSDRLVADV